ncbi:hypothetical protein [Tunturiibacter gelidiferens]|uniref:hypothetical protein n=1 Tax=Tunturiibacter gelidiferens TaxID=3069689 RepID=UPI003D9AC04E
MKELITEDLTPAAKRILGCFRKRELQAGGMIHPADFGDSIIWEAGFIRDEEVRQAWADITSKGYVTEHNAALELTKKGEQFLYRESGASELKPGEPVKLENVQDVLLGILDVLDNLRTDLTLLTTVVGDARINPPFREVVELKKGIEQGSSIYTYRLRECIRSLGALEPTRSS